MIVYLEKEDIIILKKVLRLAMRSARNKKDIQNINHMLKLLRKNQLKIQEQKKVIEKMF